MAMTQTDMSTGALPVDVGRPPQMSQRQNDFANFQRSWIGELLTGHYAADEQDYNRSEQSAYNQYLRDLAMQKYANEFNASEAEKNRDFQRELADTQYLRAYKQLKQLGINPVLALGGSVQPAGIAQGSQASASPTSTRYGRYSHSNSDSSGQILGTILTLVGQFVLGKSLSAKSNKIGF